ncbi:MAG: TonB-dependent receptor [Hymenobacteraceae bacterium]|nr:TonB-dependent receptor [Hymenobacteraceae bacterium]
MIRFLVVGGLLLAAPLAAHAQSGAPTTLPTPAASARTAPFRGQVLDARTQEPIPGASIVFPDLRQGAATDSVGRFAFGRLPRGRFLVQVRALGYAPLVLTVATDGAEPLPAFQLTPAETEIGQVVVTGVSAATEARRSPVPVVSLDRAQLDQRASTNAVEAIAHLPGINQLSTGQAVGKPIIRGMGFNRVVTLNNGARQEGQQWGDEHGIEVDEYAVDRVEIIKGPGSLLYGSDALAGVINFLPPDPLPAGRIIAQTSANYQTNARLQGYSAMTAGNADGFVWLARGTFKQAGNFRNRHDGPVFNSGFQELDANGYVGLNRAWGFSHLTLNSFNQELAVPEGERDSLTGRFLREFNIGDSLTDRIATTAELRGYQRFAPQQRINHRRLGLDNSFVLGTSRLTVTAGWQQNRRREFEPLLGTGTPSLDMRLQTIDYAARLYLPEAAGWTPTVGLSGMVQRNTNHGQEALIPNYSLFDGGVFGLLKRSFGNVDVSGGARYDVRTIATTTRLVAGLDPELLTRFASFDRTFRNVSAGLGAAWNVSEHLTLKANAARGFRAPNIAELGSNGQHEGTLRYELGATDLRAETSLQLDAGLAYTTDHISLQLDAFRNRIQSYIYTRRVLNRAGTADSVSDEGTTVFRYQQGDAVLVGGEATLDLHPHPLDWLHFENSFSMVRAEQRHVSAGERYLPFIPADRFQSELRVTRAALGPRVAHLYARLAAEHTFRQERFYAAFATETGTAGYTLINAGIGADILNSHRYVIASLHLTATNLFDVAYQSHLSRLKFAAENYATGRRGIFNPGRNVSLKLTIPLVLAGR